MASQVAHIVYAKKYLEKFPRTAKEVDLFFLGSVFPDIRRVDKEIPRSATHMKFSPVDLDFSRLNSFEAGWKFHLYCDMKREEILRNFGFYDLNQEKEVLWEAAAKLVEDELVYDQFNNWDKMCGFFDNPPTIFLPDFVSKEAYQLWYAILAKYFSEKPNPKTVHIFISKLNSLPERADVIVEKFQEIRQNKKAVEMLSNIYQAIV